MRRTFSGKEFAYKEDGSLFGINLGADATTEHEVGFSGLIRKFGIDKSLLGVDARLTRTVPESLYFGDIEIDKITYTYLLCLYRDGYLEYYDGNVTETLISDCELRPYKGDDIWTSWDEDSFGILVTEKYKDELSKLYYAFKALDVVVGMAPGVFISGGLKFVIRSKMTEEEVADILSADMSKIRLQFAAEETGIHKILKDAGKRYFALSPRWKDESESEVIFWLNPWEQDKHNFGWFTVDDLKEWADNKGKIMMKKKYV